MTWRRGARIVASLLVASFAGDALCASSPGDADPSWTIDNTYPVQMVGIAVQPDGGVIGVGHDSVSGTRTKFAAVRLDPNGIVDRSFGSDGYVTTGIGDDSSYGRGVVLLDDGSFVVVGNANESGQRGIAIAKYLATGALDPSFASGGVFTDFQSGLDAFFAGGLGDLVVRQADGKLLFVGQGSDPVNHAIKAIVVRLGPDGALDRTFGSSGRKIFQAGSGTTTPGVIRVAADGKIYVVGDFMPYSGGNQRMFVARLHADGSLDSSFGSAGILFPLSDEIANQANGFTLQDDGKLLIAGRQWVDPDTVGAMVVRLDERGGLDPGFGDNGVTFMDLTAHADWASSVTVDDQGRVVVAGLLPNASGFAEDGFVVRLSADGSLDGGFANDGVALTSRSTAYAVTHGANGKLYVRTSPYAVERLFNEVPAVLSVSFSASAESGEAPLDVTFAAMAQSSESGDTLSYAWDFGDGSTSDSPAPTHLFTSPGRFTVRLTVSNQGGQSEWYERTIQVSEAAQDLFASGAVDCLFDWGEFGFTQWLRPSGRTTRWSAPYHYRYYPETHSYIGVSTDDEHLYFLSDVAGLVDLGAVDQWLGRAGCR